MNRRRKRYFLGSAVFWSLFLYSFLLLALHPGADTEKSDYFFTAWQIEDGLPQNYIGKILQDRDGYIWLGTQEGVVRFDGVTFVTFNSDNTPEIKQSNITALAEDREGNLWIGTYKGGLLRYKAGKFTNYSPKLPEPNNVVTAICKGRDGSVRLNTLGGELLRLENGKVTTLNPKGIITDCIVHCLYEDSRGNLRIGTKEKGLITFKEGKCSTYDTTHGLSHNSVLSICEDPEGNLWIGTDGGGLNRLKDGKFETFTVKDGLSNNFVHAIYVNEEGEPWIGTQGGLDRFIDGKWVNYGNGNESFKEIVISIARDREENLWVGTMGGGLFQLKQSKVRTYTTGDSLPEDMVGPISGDRSGALWIGLWATGITRMKNGKFDIYTMDHGLSGTFVSVICEDRGGTLWIGTRGSGLNRFEDEKFTVYTTENGLSSNYIHTVCGGRDGSLWVGTEKGVDRLKDGKVTHYTTDNGLPDKSVNSIYEDSRGKLWIATSYRLVRFERGMFETVDANGLLTHHNISVIYEDKQKNLWFGTDGGGLLRFKDGKFTAYTAKEGLFDNRILQVLEDDRGNLWMSCNKGIFRVPVQEFDRFDKGKGQSIRCISYGKEYGMKNSECVGGVQPAGCKTPDGKLWFPTAKGVVMIDPGKIKSNPVVPPVVIEKLKIDDRVTDPVQHMEIPPGKRRLEFQYTALSFVAPRKIKFKYRLDGFDEEWNDAGPGTGRSAHYTNIPPGDYCFRVIACNNDGIWNETGAVLYFRLNPFFYQTYWFYGVCVLCVLAIGLGVHLLRVAQLLKKERKKYEKVRLSSECGEQYLQELLQFMEREKPYLDPGISLGELSKRLGIPDYHLSQVINGRLSRNFNDFINHYRIEEARRILTRNENRLTIIEVAFEVGFNSKSTFNRVFKKHTDMTPSRFIKKR